MRIILTPRIFTSDLATLSKYQIDLKESTDQPDVCLNQPNVIGYLKHQESSIKFYWLDKKSGEVQSTVYKDVCDYLKQRQYYKQLKTLDQYPYHGQTKPVDFDGHVERFILDNEFTSKLMRNREFSQYFWFVLNTGVYFRLPRNKRQRTYWNPPFASLPMVGKGHKGKIGEIVFQCHDIGHFMLPDAIYLGETDPLSRQVYILWRLIGEAITLAYNEMYLLERAHRMGVIADIEPDCPIDKPLALYRQMGGVLNLETLLRASILYFVSGNTLPFESLIGDHSGNTEVLDAFVARYDAVMKRGVEWTCDNWNNLVSNSNAYRKWKEFIGDDAFDDLNFFKVETLVAENEKSNNLLEDLTGKALDTVLKGLKKTDQLEPLHLRTYRAFKKWMLGNLLLFFRNGFEDHVWNIMSDIKVGIKMMASIEDLDQMRLIISNLRSSYEKALWMGVQLEILDGDDFETYRDVYPMIDNNIIDEVGDDGQTLRQCLESYGLT